MRAPDFWQQDGRLAALLGPLGSLYGLGLRARFAFATPWSAPVPVVCVGNLTMGGAGKTPVALDLARRLPDVHFLSRGYGGRETGPLRVDPAVHGPDRVGDEPLLLAQRAPTWVAADRVAGARAAVAAGAKFLVMDDGFQNPSLAKDFSLVVVDGEAGFGNARVFPAGPLREPVAQGLARAQAVVLVGENRHGLDFGNLPVLRACVTPGPEAAGLRGRELVAFAGLGRPEKFFATLRGLGCRLAEARPFPDHHPYTEADLKSLAARGLPLVTTAKDAVRLPPGWRARVEVLTIALSWDDDAALTGRLDVLR
ncbi:MAG: tetraacyldisaccharide 4'-kinase [Magnetospirillum sp. WYHS-4]